MRDDIEDALTEIGQLRRQLGLEAMPTSEAVLTALYRVQQRQVLKEWLMRSSLFDGDTFMALHRYQVWNQRGGCACVTPCGNCSRL